MSNLRFYFMLQLASFTNVPLFLFLFFHSPNLKIVSNPNSIETIWTSALNVNETLAKCQANPLRNVAALWHFPPGYFHSKYHDTFVSFCANHTAQIVSEILNLRMPTLHFFFLKIQISCPANDLRWLGEIEQWIVKIKKTNIDNVVRPLLM